MRVTEPDLAHLNARFEGAPPLDLLRFVASTFGHRAAILSSMQKAGTALCFLADRAALPLDVLFVDTGVLHVETLHTRDELARTHPNLRVLTLYPDRSFAEQTRDEGLLYLSKEGQERCCDLRKSLPLRRVKGRYDALVSALRRGEGGARAKVQPFGLDPELGALRIHPFHALGRDELEALAAQPGVAVNPLHGMGFPTIGCFPCTTPVLPDETERAGRWRHLASVTYCGINPIDRDDDGGIDLDDRYREILAGA